MTTSHHISTCIYRLVTNSDALGRYPPPPTDAGEKHGEGKFRSATDDETEGKWRVAYVVVVRLAHVVHYYG